MKTDRELLELAARSIGLLGSFSEYHQGITYSKPGSLDMHVWSPLTDDGDALRLAVACNLTVCTDGSATVSACQEFDRANVFATQSVGECGSCKFTATRRAITRAAAAIGESMK